jgi:hypothetical protein
MHQDNSATEQINSIPFGPELQGLNPNLPVPGVNGEKVEVRGKIIADTIVRDRERIQFVVFTKYFKFELQHGGL